MINVSWSSSKVQDSQQRQIQQEELQLQPHELQLQQEGVSVSLDISCCEEQEHEGEKQQGEEDDGIQEK